jgi:hypothetical protein
MSGAACVIIIDETKKTAAVVQSAESLFTMEMARQVTIPPECRDHLRAALAQGRYIIDSALQKCLKAAGPPHDHPEG